MYPARDVLTTEDDFRSLHRDPHISQTHKIIDHIDVHCRTWIERSPFLVMATYDANGKVDVSPRGDPAGFVKILDQKTLAIPDRPGNYRYDSFTNILETGRIGLVFFVSNRKEVVRVNGTARIVRDEDIRNAMAIKDRVPHLAVLVDVEEAFYHCGKAIIRSGLWQPEQAVSVEGMATYAEAVTDQAHLSGPVEELEDRFAKNEENRLYDH
ncbi:MSMEG_1061 family FMN-dependent PPOX-type flavoprotein [Boseongicola aestuarii]|uniref:Pyridoxamine 5'-phosphate oxidase n=1 Tax=Boseongicola aestuarii TaxID=1470561 RepID=A0A238IYU9_9RHOB|nr:MSMEG_1061 family FMN-dependent PPOX-type flavoprotein [Boseongicola aestuarii]SMX23201.1 Pyridoxamine 5'-phosphate oxidase [Boseongicola aestuarii]